MHRSASALALTSLLTACESSSPPPEEAADCAWSGGAPAEDPTLQTNAPAIQLGSGRGDAFDPWTDGKTLERVEGGQGLQMITPTVRVVDAADMGDTCLYVEIGEPAIDMYEIGGTSRAYEFAPVGDHLEAGPVFMIFEDYVEERDVELHAIVTADTWQSVLDVGVHVVSPE